MTNETDTTSRHVALLDDDELVRRALVRFLRGHAFPVKAYDSAHAFLKSVGKNLPACLILDLNMPDMSGLALLHHLAEGGIQIPTIIMTGHDDANVRHRCEIAGAIAFFVKPAPGDALLAAIESAAAIGLARYSRAISSDLTPRRVGG